MKHWSGKLLLLWILLLPLTVAAADWKSAYGLKRAGRSYQLPANVPPLLRAIERDADPETVEEAAGLLLRLDRKAALPALEARLGRGGNAELVERLTGILAQAAPERRAAVYLKAFQVERDPGNRLGYAEKLLKVASPETKLAVLRELAAVPHPGARATALNGLLPMVGATDPTVVALLLDALGSSNARNRIRGLRQVEKSGAALAGNRALQDRVATLAERDPHRGVRQQAGQTLVALQGRQGGRGTPAPVPPAAKPAPVGGETVEAEENSAVAVIIGNRNYAPRHRDVPDVRYAHNDADAVKAYLTGQLAFDESNIIDLRDATQGEMVGIFGNRDNPRGRLYNWLRPGESEVFVYYSGHGAPGLNDGSSYLLPVDADPATVELNGYPLQTLYGNLAKLPARSVTVVIDACFAGTSPAGTLVKSASSIALRRKEPAAPQRAGLTVLAAARDSEVASWDEKEQLGLFTAHFLKGVKGKADSGKFGNGDGKVTVGELKGYLESEVTYWARRNYNREQHPQVSGNAALVLTGEP